MTSAISLPDVRVERAKTEALDRNNPVYEVFYAVCKAGIVDVKKAERRMTKHSALDKLKADIEERLSPAEKYRLVDQYVYQVVLGDVARFGTWKPHEAALFLYLAVVNRPIIKLMEDTPCAHPAAIRNYIRMLREHEEFDTKSVHPGLHCLHTMACNAYGLNAKPFFMRRGESWLRSTVQEV